ncbi:winged helix-turn-helix domain-containing protein [Muricauda sp. CAU 1633]|uniref:winged helix-turn-helix domain-containing protein n=1 Tax=Allomuricauda sp. CAU 1633 TaxID=2816036 RepID=UPI001A8E4090|nr:winged helix-turn-helix domain-containing protein [Muricauda sp. CAU 1633]MBO0324045.1 winged helix-turn-helix domain-containing protein [Muricauda sp. CAU 1633]
MRGPRFLKYWIPLIEVLKESGGAGPTSEIIDGVIEKMGIPEQELDIKLKSGAPKVRNTIQFARLYLVKAELIDSSKRGIWKLTEKGFESNLNDEKVYRLFKKVQKTLSENKKVKEKTKDNDFEEDEVLDESHQTAVLNILKIHEP